MFWQVLQDSDCFYKFYKFSLLWLFFLQSYVCFGKLYQVLVLTSSTKLCLVRQVLQFPLFWQGLQRSVWVANSTKFCFDIISSTKFSLFLPFLRSCVCYGKLYKIFFVLTSSSKLCLLERQVLQGTPCFDKFYNFVFALTRYTKLSLLWQVLQFLLFWQVLQSSVWMASCTKFSLF